MTGDVVPITEARAVAPAGAKFSILVPTWNNLSYLQACIASLREHSGWPHEIIVHVNDGSDGTLEWVRSAGISYTHSSENVGVCHALNASAAIATTGYICYFNDDMLALPGWDDALWREIESLDHDRWFLSGTMIEPTGSANPCAIAPHDYGRSLESLGYEALLAEYASLPHQDWTGATWPPNVVPRALWDEVGGYSVEFSPGMSSDPDFSMKLWAAGVRYFKGLSASRVYHFQARSTGKVTKNDGRAQFIAKWQVTQSAFSRCYLRRGEPWQGALTEPRPGVSLLLGRLKGMLGRSLRSLGTGVG